MSECRLLIENLIITCSSFSWLRTLMTSLVSGLKSNKAMTHIGNYRNSSAATIIVGTRLPIPPIPKGAGALLGTLSSCITHWIHRMGQGV